MCDMRKAGAFFYAAAIAASAACSAWTVNSGNADKNGIIYSAIVIQKRQ